MEVSVIIPVYNAEKFLEKVIYSALQQKEVLKVIIIDEASQDNTMIIAQELRQNILK